MTRSAATLPEIGACVAFEDAGGRRSLALVTHRDVERRRLSLVVVRRERPTVGEVKFLGLIPYVDDVPDGPCWREL